MTCHLCHIAIKLEPFCSNCKAMLEALPGKLNAIVLLRESTGCSIYKGQDLLAWADIHQRKATVLPPVADLVKRIEFSGLRAAAVQALWDGDSTGWFVILSLAGLTDQGLASTLNLVWITEDEGDMRIFNGEVPPWPEAKRASELGQALADQLGVPFYFPSPDEPNDRCPAWFEREIAVRLQTWT